MTTPTYAQAAATQTAAQIRDSLLLPQLAAAGSPVQGLPTSSPDRGIIEAEANFLATEAQLRAGVAATISPDTVVTQGSSWVDAVMGWFQLPDGQGGIGRLPALQAVWTIGLNIPSTMGSLTLSPGDIVQIQALTGQIFNLVLVAPVVLNSASSYKATCAFQARMSGNVAGNPTPGTLTNIITGPAGLGVDGGVTQVNLSPGTDAESDYAYVKRGLGRWAALGAGWTDQAFDYLIPLLSPTVTRWRVDSANPFGPGTTGVYLADPTGPASGGEVAAVQLGLAAPNVRPNGSGQVVVVAATAYNDTITVTVKGDGSNPTLAADITTAISALTAQLPLGPIYVTVGFLVELCLGKAFTGTTAFQTSAGAYAELPFVLPGFGGAVAVVSLSSSQGFAGGGSGPNLADVVPIGQVLVATPAVTVT